MNGKPTLTVVFPDGVSFTGTAAGILARLGALQAEPTDAYGMAVLLARRAAAWSGANLDPSDDPEAFLRAFAALPHVLVVDDAP